MKRFLILLWMLFCILPCVMAKTADVHERTVLTTDRNSYLAGEKILVSAFCLDEEGMGLSALSSVAYVQLCGVDGTVCTAKIGLENGRGAGYVVVPDNLPTGNYSLFGFTAVNKNAETFDYLCSCNEISVFNVNTADREAGKVMIQDANVYRNNSFDYSANDYTKSGVLSLKVPFSQDRNEIIPIKISNSGSLPATMSVSVWNDDNLVPLRDTSLVDRVRSATLAVYTDSLYLPEYDGEIIYAEVRGNGSQNVIANFDKYTATVSCIGNADNAYSGVLLPDGKVAFKTYNIYGSSDIVSEIYSDNIPSEAYLAVCSPFVDVSNPNVSPLIISEAMEPALLRRSEMLSKEKADSSSSYKYSLFVDNCSSKVYHLDDYARFPTINEVLVEIVPELRLRGANKTPKIQVYAKSAVLAGFNWDTALVLLDGVPIHDIGSFLSYDAMLIKDVKVWQTPVYVGRNYYAGAVNFISSEGNVRSFDFSPNVRISDFQGLSYPSNHFGLKTIYWNPMQTLNAGDTINIECPGPSYKGKFRIVIEGVLQDGTPFCESSIYFAN